jgi:hypothetical protein
MRNRITTVLACCAFLPLAGCATTKTVEVTARPVELSIIQPPNPEPVTMLNTKVRVVTASNIEEFIAEAKREQGTDNPVFVVSTTKDYEALSLNIAELKRYIKQQQQIIAYYKKATSPLAPKKPSQEQ